MYVDELQRDVVDGKAEPKASFSFAVNDCAHVSTTLIGGPPDGSSGHCRRLQWNGFRCASLLLASQPLLLLLAAFFAFCFHLVFCAVCCYSDGSCCCAWRLGSMRLAIEKAREVGVGWVVAHRTVPTLSTSLVLRAQFRSSVCWCVLECRFQSFRCGGLLQSMATKEVQKSNALLLALVVFRFSTPGFIRWHLMCVCMHSR